jgi:5-methylcytosine-specific restriction protein A
MRIRLRRDLRHARRAVIEAHHILPLAQAGATTTRLADLALVCSNCHRMLHRAAPWISPAQLQERLHGRI